MTTLKSGLIDFRLSHLSTRLRLPWPCLVVAALLAGCLAPGCASTGLLHSEFDREPGRDLWRLATETQPPEGEWLPLEPDGSAHRGAVTVSEGWWESPAVRVEPFHYYRVALRAKTAVPAVWGAIYFDTRGLQLIADNYHGIDPSEAYADVGAIVRAPQRAAFMVLRLRHAPEQSLAISSVDIRPAGAAEAARFSDQVLARLPALNYRPPADRWAALPATGARLAAGKPLRIVMLGDSICNDTSNSNYELLVAENWRDRRGGPLPTIHVVTSVRGGTGCDFYAQEGRVKPYVLDFEPDLLIIAGISSGPDVEPMRSVIQQVKRARPQTEVLVLTGAVTPASFLATFRKWNPEAPPSRGRFVADPAMLDSVKAMPARAAATRIGLDAYGDAMQAMAREEGVAFLDMRRAWDDYLQSSGKPQEYFLRDPLHANQRAKEIVGRILAAYLSPE